MPGVNISQLVADVATELIAETKMKVEDRAEFALLQHTKARFQGRDGTEAEVKRVLMKVLKAAHASAVRRGAQAVDEEDIKAVTKEVRG